MSMSLGTAERGGERGGVREWERERERERGKGREGVWERTAGVVTALAKSLHTGTHTHTRTHTPNEKHYNANSANDTSTLPSPSLTRPKFKPLICCHFHLQNCFLISLWSWAHRAPFKRDGRCSSLQCMYVCNAEPRRREMGLHRLDVKYIALRCFKLRIMTIWHILSASDRRPVFHIHTVQTRFDFPSPLSFSNFLLNIYKSATRLF